MLTLQLNLENEQGLQTGFDKLFDSLSIEDKKEIAKEALLQYLTNTIDYEKEKYKKEVLENVRKNGIKGEYQLYDISIEKAETLTDDQLAGQIAVSKKINSYKTARESRYDEINNILMETLKTDADKFINENNDLLNIIQNQQKAIEDSFPELTKSILTSLFQTMFLQVVNNALFAVPQMYEAQSIIQTKMSDVMNRLIK